MVYTEFGPALAAIDLDQSLSANAEIVQRQILDAMAKRTRLPRRMEFAFGCTLFGGGEVQPFEIGPVRFETRLRWLQRKQKDGGLSLTAMRRIELAWGGQRLQK